MTAGRNKQIPPLPMKLIPAPVERVWGGSSVETLFGWAPPEGAAIGEWWTLSFRKEHPSLVADGPLKGSSLDLVKSKHPHLIGEGAEPALLIKIIDARERLSVQVHPNDELARSMGLASGKTECWHYLKSARGALIFRGLRKELDLDEFFDEAASRPEPDRIEALLHAEEVQEGETAFIPAGLIHAVGEGCVIVEVQQDSDTTFRIYDWGRPRETDLESARKAASHLPADPAQPPPADGKDDLLLSCSYFSLRRLELTDGRKLPEGGPVFSAAMVIDGKGEFRTEGCRSRFGRGDTFFLPALSPPVTIETSGSATMLLASQTEKELP